MADTADNTSSMLSDVMAGRRTEVDSIVGWLLIGQSSKIMRTSSTAQSTEIDRANVAIAARQTRASGIENDCVIELCRPVFTMLGEKFTDTLCTIDTDDDLGRCVIRNIPWSIGNRIDFASESLLTPMPPDWPLSSSSAST